MPKKNSKEEKLATKRKWYWNNREKVRELAKKSWKKHKVKRYAECQAWASKNRPLIRTMTREWYRKKQEKLAGRIKPETCELCGKIGRICFDHDHETGKFRGWICHECNVCLGLVSDNAQILQKMIEYLIKNKE